MQNPPPVNVDYSLFVCKGIFIYCSEAKSSDQDSVQVSFHINTTHGRLKTYLLSNTTLKAQTQKRHLMVLVEATCPDYFLQFDRVFKLGIIIIRQF